MSAKIIFLTTEARRGRAPDVPVSLGLMDTFLSAAVGAGLYSNVRNLRRYLAWLFAGVDLRGKRFLDVGAGQGLYSLYAAAQGACAVVALEPQAAGSRQGAYARMQNLAQEWGLSLRHLPEDLEAHAADHGDDVILLHNVINHLDEPRKVRLMGRGPVSAGRVSQVISGHAACAPVSKNPGALHRGNRFLPPYLGSGGARRAGTDSPATSRIQTAGAAHVLLISVRRRRSGHVRPTRARRPPRPTRKG